MHSNRLSSTLVNLASFAATAVKLEIGVGSTWMLRAPTATTAC